MLLSQVYCVWQVVKTPAIISNNPVDDAHVKFSSTAGMRKDGLQVLGRPTRIGLCTFYGCGGFEAYQCLYCKTTGSPSREFEKRRYNDSPFTTLTNKCTSRHVINIHLKKNTLIKYANFLKKKASEPRFSDNVVASTSQVCTLALQIL